VTLDQHGLVTSTPDTEAVELYDVAIDHLLHFRPAVMEALAASLEIDPSAAMSQVLQAYLGLLGTEPEDAQAARSSFESWCSTSDQSALMPRERQHVAAVQDWLGGDMSGAGLRLSALTCEFPRDALALAIGHQIDFFSGDATSLRDRVGGALSAWSSSDKHYGHLLGMYAFGLEEAGHYDRSEDVGLSAVETNPKDVWAIHAVVHTFEMQGRSADGSNFLDVRRGDFGTGNFLNVHNWWHYALYSLESGESTSALEVYDAVLHNCDSEGLVMEMLDAASLLWRLLLEGEDQSERWSKLADAWTPKMAQPYYSFNDMHAVMSFVGAGRIGEAERLIEQREKWLLDAPATVTNARMTREIGLPVCRSILAFGQGRYSSVVEMLTPLRHRINEFGGSHAQRDAVQRTLLEAALRCGQHDLTRTLVSERISIRPCSAYAWLKQASLAEQVGQDAEAATARNRAHQLSELVPAATPPTT